MRKFFFDGGCRPNPGAMAAAVVTGGVTYHWPALGVGDNNDAEWRALIAAATLAQSLGAHDVVLIGDSALAIAQAKRRQPCRAARFEAYRDRFDTIAASFERLRLRHVLRSHNLAGIALDRIAAGYDDPVRVMR